MYPHPFGGPGNSDAADVEVERTDDVMHQGHRRFSAAVVVAALVSLSACLAPNAVDPTGHAPFGNLELNAQSGAGIRVVGWAIDPDTTAPIDVQVKVEGQDLRNVRADRQRPDVAAAYPGRGSAHGFDLTVPDLGPGKRQVCVWANDVGVGGDTRVLGCRDIFINVDPFGSIESVVGSPDRTIHVSGWVADPETTAATDVGILLDGAFVVSQRTDVARPDVAAAYGLGALRGYGISFPAPVGDHNVCVVAGNVGWGAARFIGCRGLVVPPLVDHRPDLRLSAVTPLDSGRVRIQGTATDPDSSAPVTVNVRVDGAAVHSTTAIGGVVDLAVTGLAAGRHELCVYALDVPGGSSGVTGDRIIPCSWVVLGAGSQPSVGTVGASSSSGGVGPLPGMALERIDRDAGVSVSLRDGSTLWLFGDSSEAGVDGTMLYLVNNTAAWAPPGAAAVTRDAASAGRPTQFVDPGGAFSCPANRPVAALWPMSAVATPSGTRDVVTAFFAEVCIGPGFLNVEDHGVTVVRWTYDPASPPSWTPIRGTIQAQNLFPRDKAYGSAAIAIADPAAGTGDGGWFVYGYQCRSPQGAGPFQPADYGPCTVGRVPVDSVTSRTAWRFWNGTTWVSDVAQAAAIIPGGGSNPEIPVAAFTVTRDDALDAYVMAYSPWPGFIDRVYVRVAPSPVGPWTTAVPIQLPGCEDRIAAQTYRCYAGSAQPWSSSAAAGVTSLGIGWYDQLVSANPPRGQYRAATVPFAIRW